MFSGTGKKYYDINGVLASVNQEQLFLHYMGILPNSAGRFHSPFRKDNNPGCRFSWHSGILYLVENSMYKNKLYWSIFDCLMERYNLTFLQAVETVVNDYKLNGAFEKHYVNKTKKERPVITFSYKPWPEDNLFYLDNDILQKEFVFLVDDYWINKQKNPIHNPKQVLTIAYYFPDSNHVKLYFPFADTIRWYSNCDTSDIFGKYKIDYYHKYFDYLVITKSQKDRLILDYHFKIPTIAVQNEGSFLPESFVEDIRERFPNIYVLFDNDIAGERAATKISQKYGFEKITLPFGKDSYEMFKQIKTICLKY